jgi:hypothetical protein
VTNQDERRLVSIRRWVSEQAREEYDAAWLRLHTAATGGGGHAWRFASASEANLYLEFLEFATERDLRADPEIVASLHALHQNFGDPYPPPRTIEEWIGIP